MSQRIFIKIFILASICTLIIANRTNRNLNLQQLQNRCLTHQSTAAKSSTCITQKKLKMQITRGVENGVFYCLTYEKNTGNVYGFDSLTIELHPDYDLQYSGANVIDYEFPSFKLYDVRVSQEYKGRFAVYSNNTAFKVYQVTINNEQQSCTYGKGKNRLLWPEPRKVVETEEEEDDEKVLTTFKPSSTEIPSTTTTTVKPTTVKPAVPSKSPTRLKSPRITSTTTLLPTTTEATTTLAPTTQPATTTERMTTTPFIFTTELPVTTEIVTQEITTEPIIITTIPPEPKMTCGTAQKIIDFKQFSMPYNPGEFPFAVSIFHKPDENAENVQLKCSGTIISSDIILTSVNCLLDRNSRMIKEDDLAVVAAQYLSDAKYISSQRAFLVDKIVAHEGFNFNLDNNLAVLKLKFAIEFDDFVQPICLPERNLDIGDDNSVGKLIGFGKSSMLAETDFKIEMNEICKESSCKTFNGNSASVENIDLGCGLYINDKERWTLAGISSIVPNRASKNVEFTNVIYYMDWIERLFH